MNTLTLAEAAGFLKMHPEEVRCRAKRGLIPASKPGRRWVFIDEYLAEFLRSKYATDRQALRVTSEKTRTPWVSANGSKAKATEFHDRLKAEVWRQQKLEEAPRRSWNDAVVRWCKEHSHKATAEEDKAKLRSLDQHLGGKELDTINRDMIERISQAKLDDRCSNATVNRTLALVRSILRK